jgi:hypothetical protein
MYSRKGGTGSGEGAGEKEGRIAEPTLPVKIPVESSLSKKIS